MKAIGYGNDLKPEAADLLRQIATALNSANEYSGTHEGR